MNFEQAYAKVKEAGQTHILQYYQDLTEEQQKALLTQIDETDFLVLDAIKSKGGEVKGKISPLVALQVSQIEAKREAYTKEGLTAIREGKVAAVLLAGGMGTRLGSDDPKGMYNIGITKEVYIFQRIIENLLDVVQQADTWIHLFVMTSDKNHKATTEFLHKHAYFGYNPSYISFFKQEMAPASDYEGKVYMEEKWKMSTSPNGNGGWFISMKNTGILDKAKQEGIEWLNAFSVDNVLQRMADPCFVGAVLESGCVSGAKVVRKNAPDEKVGVICLEDGHPSIVEYYELTDELMNTKDEQGEPAYNYGVILNYLFKLDALEKMMEKKLPLHVVEKKIPYLNEEGKLVKPESPNGYKFESLILDMIHDMEDCLPYEVVREKEFAPIKNKTGIDSVESARELLKQNNIAI